MVSLMDLWLPIVLSAVLVFVMSSIIHMLLTYHRKDWDRLPGEAEVLSAMREASVSAGDYAFPYPESPKDMGTPEMIEKYKQGPVGFMTVAPSGSPSMGKSLIQWFLYSLGIGVFVAYITSRTMGPSPEYLEVFRVAGAVAFLGYAGGEPVQAIWGKRKWGTIGRHIFDGFVYALVTAGAFAGFWPA